MRADETSSRSDNLAIRYGLRFGYAAGLAGLAAGAFSALATSPGGAGAQFRLPGCLPFLIALYLFGEAGHWTARRVGTIGSGTLAAVLTGMLAGLGLAIGFYGVRLIGHQLSATKVTGAEPVFATAVGTTIGAIFNVGLFAGIGAGVGAFGASIGRDQHRKRAQAGPASTATSAQRPLPLND